MKITLPTSRHLLPKVFFSAIVATTLGSASAASFDWAGVTTGLGGGTNDTWDTATTANFNIAPHVVWPGSGTDNEAVFSGTAGTVTVSTVSANRLTFNAAGYTLAGSTITLNGTTPTVTTTGTSTTATISSALVSSAGYTKAGLGTLTVSGNNTAVTGTISVTQGTLAIGNNAALGSGTAPLINASVTSGATLQYNSGIQTASVGNLTINGSGVDSKGALYFAGGGSRVANTSGTITLGAGGATIGVAGAVNLIGRVAGSGTSTLTVTGPGTLSMESNNANTYTGLTVVTGGATLQLAKSSGTLSNRISVRNNVTVDSGATLALGRSSQFLTTGTTSAIIVTNNGTLDLNTYSGTATASVDNTIGALAGSGKVTTSTSATQIPLITLTLAANDLGTRNFSGEISDTNSLNLVVKTAILKTGNATQVLSGASTFSGGTTISGGVLNAGGDGALGAGNVTVTGGSLTIWSGVAGVSDAIDDTATLSLATSTFVTLSGGVEYVGALILNGVSQVPGSYTAAPTGFIQGMGSIVVIPEPGTYAVAVGALLFVVVAFRRRKLNA